MMRLQEVSCGRFVEVILQAITWRLCRRRFPTLEINKNLDWFSKAQACGKMLAMPQPPRGVSRKNTSYCLSIY
jgi:hypothetical protein